MKVNAEKFLINLDQYKFEKTVFFITGNEEGLINKVQNIILSKFTHIELKIRLEMIFFVKIINMSHSFFWRIYNFNQVQIFGADIVFFFQ